MTTLKSFFGSINTAALLAASAPLAIVLPSTSAMAQSTVTGHCQAVVANNTIPPSTSGQNPLFGGVYADLNQSSGATTTVLTAPGMTGPTGLGQVCHNAAIAAFKANPGWTPAEFCKRTPDGKKHRVQLLTILTELGGPHIGHVGGYNQVAGYDVTCAGPVDVVPLTRQVVAKPF